MTWTHELKGEIPSEQLIVQPKEVLYNFDGPQIFVSQFGFFKAIFVKIDDMEHSELWLCASVDDELIKLIIGNRISVRSAFMREYCWVIQTGGNFQVEQYWSCPRNDISEEMLPSPGVALRQPSVISVESIGANANRWPS